MSEIVFKDFEEHKNLIQKTLSDIEFINKIDEAISLIHQTLENKHKVLLAGNGGSAADSQHFAAELVGRFEIERRGLNVIALTTDTSIITSVGNDYGYDRIFSRQLEGVASDGDIFVAISTSGNSKNILEAVKFAKENDIKVIGLLGKDGGEIKNYCDIDIIVPSNNTARIQEVHELIIHTICKNVENNV